MAPEFKVLQVTELVEIPSIWQLGSTRFKKFAEALEEALNRMAKEGWVFVGSHVPIGTTLSLASGFLIVRRDK